MSVIAVAIGIVILFLLFGKSRTAGVHFSVFMLIVIWLAFFGGWDRVVTVYHHWTNPNPPHVVKTGNGVGKIITELKNPVPGDPGGPVR